MSHKITTISGNSAEISDEEAHRIAKTVWESKESRENEMRKVNHRYWERALDNIMTATGMEETPDTEHALKKILYMYLPGFSKRHVEVLYEVMEAMVAMHTKCVFDSEDDYEEEDED